MVRQPKVIANSQLVKLRYVTRFSLDASLNTGDTYVLSASNLYDPDPAAGGHQPIGFDQWMAFYDHYTVIGAKAKMSVAQGNAGPGDFTYIGINLKDNVIVDTTNIDLLLEQKGASIATMGTGSTHATQSITKTFSGKKFFNNDMKDDIYRGTALGGPAEQAYFHFFATAMSAADNPAPLKCVAIVDYIVMLTERKPLPQS